MEELKNELREIVNRPATKLTKADKAFLVDAAARVGVDATIENPRCGTCWHELAMRIYNAVEGKPAEPAEPEDVEQGEEKPEPEECEQAEEKPEPRYVLKKGVDVIFGKVGRVGVRVNALTLTDELGDKLIAAGFPKKYFERCE